MADNVTLPGTGGIIATDEVGGAQYQRVKLALGADGAAADLAPGQALMAASVPVVLASNQSAVPVSGTVTASGPLTDTQLRASAVPVSGTFYQATQPVSIASTVAVTDNSGSLTVDGTVAISGTVAVTDNSTTLSVDDGGGSLTVDGTVAVSGTVAVTDNGGSLTVDGDVTITSPDVVVTVTPTLDTSAYASGDLLFDSTEVAAAVRANAATAILQSITITDKGDQGVAFTLLIANAATDFGTLNSAPDPDDTEAATVVGVVPVLTTDYVDLGGARVACIRNIGLLLKAGAATTSVWIAGINGAGTPTFAASDLVFQMGFLRS